jgi:outer membrane protein OmpA-like peptidoglycan-associated protein/opacity protein-like surface antigen
LTYIIISSIFFIINILTEEDIMKTTIRWAAYSTALLLIATASFSQHFKGQSSLGFYASGIKLVGGDADHSIINYTSGISYKYAFSSSLTGEFSADLGWVRPRDPDSHFKVMANAPYRTYLLPLNLNLRMNLMPSKKITPYIGTGVGVLRWTLRDVSQEDNWFPIPESGTTITGPKINLTLLGNAGIQFFLTDKIGFDLGIRYTHILGQDQDNIGTGDVNTGFLQVRLGMNLYWGGFQDYDGDGIEDKFDAEMYLPEDFDGFQDEDGAPDPDNDGDGIPDYMDKAPNLPEDIDGFEDNDGIPDLDNDKDGIPDKMDKCPDLAEDIDGFQDKDGCPDWDNDGDTIPDSLDQCPNQPETFNDYQDEDGCPDEKPKPALLEKTKKIILPAITFESGKAILLYESKKTLGQVYESLRDNPEINIEIRGYTDSIGNAASNLNLSQKRADAVKDYLIQMGIAFSRIRAIGYGEANPIASNKTKAGRAKNRRIVFLRIED